MIRSYHHDVRTTITLDDDVAAKLEGERRQSGRSFKEAVNHFLRLGLTVREPPKRKPFVIRDIGLRLGLELQSASELLERLEDPRHK